MNKTLLCLSLFLAGYLAEQTSPSVQAQAPIMGHNNDGTSWQYYPPSGPGGVGQWNNSRGQSGQIYSAPQQNQGGGFAEGLAQGFGRRNPC